MDGFEGNGGGYGNDDGTRDFFSQPEHSSAFNLYSDPPAQFPSSSSISAQRAGLSSLDLNSNGEAWPGMGRYENLLRYGQDEADGEGGFSPSPRARPCLRAYPWRSDGSIRRRRRRHGRPRGPQLRRSACPTAASTLRQRHTWIFVHHTFWIGSPSRSPVPFSGNSSGSHGG